MVNIIPIRDDTVTGGIRHINQKELPTGANLTIHPDGTYSIVVAETIIDRTAKTAKQVTEVTKE